MYFADGSAYSFLSVCEADLESIPPLNVGWLDHKVEFPEGPAQPELRNTFAEEVNHLVIRGVKPANVPTATWNVIKNWFEK